MLVSLKGSRVLLKQDQHSQVKKKNTPHLETIRNSKVFSIQHARKVNLHMCFGPYQYMYICWSNVCVQEKKQLLEHCLLTHRTNLSSRCWNITKHVIIIINVKRRIFIVTAIIPIHINVCMFLFRFSSLRKIIISLTF